MLYSNNSNKVVVNNTTNVTSNVTNGTVNTTLISNDSSGDDYSGSSDSSSYSQSSSSSEPEYGSDEYVKRWDESQQSEDSWAYLHDQPVKTDEDGHSYKRMYDEESGKSYWGQMN